MVSEPQFPEVVLARRALSSLNLLRTFEVAARRGSFKLAAEELHVTASAVSQQVRSLESQLGLELFERYPGGLRLTDTGRAYLDEIQGPLRALDDATERLRAGGRSVLRVTLMPPLASRIVLPRLADFRGRHPQIELRIDTSVRNLDLAQRQVDLAVRYGVPPWPGCVHEKLTDLYVQAICPIGLARELDLERHPERLARVPLVHMTERPDHWHKYFQHVGVIAFEPVDVFHVDDYPAAIEAAETLGAALAVWPLEQPLIDSGRVFAVGAPQGPIPEAMYAVMLEERAGDPAIRSFVEWLRRQLPKGA